MRFQPCKSPQGSVMIPILQVRKWRLSIFPKTRHLGTVETSKVPDGRGRLEGHGAGDLRLLLQNIFIQNRENGSWPVLLQLEGGRQEYKLKLFVSKSRAAGSAEVLWMIQFWHQQVQRWISAYSPHLLWFLSSLTLVLCSRISK